MIPDDVVRRAVEKKLELDQARLLVEFSVPVSAAAEDLAELIRKLDELGVRNVRFTGVYTLVPVPKKDELEVDRL